MAAPRNVRKHFLTRYTVRNGISNLYILLKRNFFGGNAPGTPYNCVVTMASPSLKSWLRHWLGVFPAINFTARVVLFTTSWFWETAFRKDKSDFEASRHFSFRMTGLEKQTKNWFGEIWEHGQLFQRFFYGPNHCKTSCCNRCRKYNLLSVILLSVCNDCPNVFLCSAV